MCLFYCIFLLIFLGMSHDTSVPSLLLLLPLSHEITLGSIKMSPILLYGVFQSVACQSDRTYGYNYLEVQPIDSLAVILWTIMFSTFHPHNRPFSPVAISTHSIVCSCHPPCHTPACPVMGCTRWLSPAGGDEHNNMIMSLLWQIYIYILQHVVWHKILFKSHSLWIELFFWWVPT